LSYSRCLCCEEYSSTDIGDDNQTWEYDARKLWVFCVVFLFSSSHVP